MLPATQTRLPTPTKQPSTTIRIQTLDFTVSQSSKYHINIPGYELISELGRGAMGVVYKARQVRADRIVALKLMINLEQARPQDIKRFTVEAQSSARLHHPNIIQVYEVGQSCQSPYFTQEFASGYRDLEYLRTDPDFDWLQNEPLMKQAETMINNAKTPKTPETPETIAKP